MSRRITDQVSRPQPITIQVNGRDVIAHEGESLATALIAAGSLAMSRDSSGRLRSPYCNMGVCFDCMVEVETSEATDGVPLRMRACLTAVRAGLRIKVAEE